MPPKKTKATATTTAKKEVESTAAAARPRRSAAATGSATKQTKQVDAPKKKATAPKAKAVPESTSETAGATKKRGRPAKVEAPSAPPTKKRGRPSKSGEGTAAAHHEHDDLGEAMPHKRGEPPFGGETTKVTADEDAAADQLEEELQDTAKPGEPAMTDSKQYWLMKAEQEDRLEKAHDGSEINTKFTIDDLRSKTKPELWDGVRNPVARNNMRAMQKGDLAFFYASGGKQGRTPGIVGIMEVVSEAEPDATTADPSTYGYVDKESDRSKWVVVGVEFRKKLTKPVSLKELQKYKEPDGKLASMQLFKQSRLSVAKVAADEWDFICNELIEGYEEG